MKILHLLKSNEYAGAEQVALTLIDESVKRGNDVVYCSPNGAIKSVLVNRNIKYLQINKFTLSEVNSIISDFKPDIVHAHDFSASIMATLVSVFHKFRIVSHLHQNPKWLQTVNFKSILHSIFLKKIDLTLVVSNAVIRGSKFLKKTPKVKVISNPLRPELFEYFQRDENTEKVYDCMFVGRFEREKDPFLFIDVVNELKKIDPDVKAAMIGSGSLEEEMRKRISKLDLTSNVSLLGYLENPYYLMSQTKVACVTSDYEGFGLAAAEFAVLAVPIVTTENVGFIEFIDDKSYLISTKEDFVKSVVRILEDESTYNEMLAASKKNYQKLSGKNIGEEMQSLYLNVIGSKL
ncbi:glycosyltransferase [Erysipelothrix anatis]|uniref:glycosyltransferase n=1 Tax=Erysipelothrix anatis TaxID=2683713 RepID=UPI00135BA388|nr:glycosyltransferase [Erysipelothrix anatis]